MRPRLIEVLKTFTSIFMITLTLDPTLFAWDGRRSLDYVKGKKGSGNSQHLIGELIRTLWKRDHLHSRRFFCVLEFQENGMPHWHILLDASFIPIEVIRARWNSFRPEKAGPVQGTRPGLGYVYFSKDDAGKPVKFEDHKHAAHYACKYLIDNPKNGFPEWLSHCERVHRFTTSKGFFPKAEPTDAELESRRQWLTNLAKRAGLDPAVVVPDWLADPTAASVESLRQLAEQYGLDSAIVADWLLDLKGDSCIDEHEALAQFGSESGLVAFSKSDGETEPQEPIAFPPEPSTIGQRVARCRSRCVLLKVHRIERDGVIEEKRSFVAKLDVSLSDLKAYLGRTESGNGVPLSDDEADRLRREFGTATIEKTEPYRQLERLIEAVDAGDFDDDEADAFQRTWDYWDAPSPEPTGEDPPLQAGGPPAGRATALACPLAGDDGCDGGSPLDSIDAFHAHLRDTHGVTGDQAWEFQNEAIDDLGDDVSRHRWARAVDEALANLLFDQAADSQEKGEAA